MSEPPCDLLNVNSLVSNQKNDVFRHVVFSTMFVLSGQVMRFWLMSYKMGKKFSLLAQVFSVAVLSDNLYNFI